MQKKRGNVERQMHPGVDCMLLLYRKGHIPMDAWQVPLDFVYKRVDRSTLYFCGFPTLQHIKHKVGVCACVQFTCASF